ncbi:MAG: HAD-IC family P-type ATPase, partial [Chloroflexi bacterium]|nr:HAD-IC family P-type ATPase [Chloroflexota bacterium]
MEKFSPQVTLSSLNGSHWHALNPDEILEKLNTQADQGLSGEEAQQRLKELGPNELTEAPPTTFWQMLWSQFNNFVVIMLIVAAVISLLLGDYIEAGAVLAIVVLNATLGVVQERNAEQALAALRKLAAPEAQVIRDGHRLTVPANQLVPGDVVVLEAGNYVPADLRLIEAVNLRIEEAALTGESVPVQKDAGVRLQADIPLGDRKNTAFMGTLVNYGRGRGVVVSTGMNTQIGLIAEMLQAVEQDPTPLQRRLDQLGKTLGWAAMAICALVFLVGILRGHELLDMFMIAVGLAIAAVPEGLPAVVTISLALGMREMIKRHALIRRLSSVETLGSATTICTDKTGTLTQNEMTATRMWVDGTTFHIGGSGYTPRGEFSVDGQAVELGSYPAALTNLWVATLNNDALLEVSGVTEGQRTYRMVGDPTEGSLVVATAKAGVDLEQLYAAYPRVQEVPFDSNRKRMLTVHRVADPRPGDISPFYDQQKREWFTIQAKGAPDVILGLCDFYQCMDDRIQPMTEAVRAQVMQANDSMARDALRVLGMAYRITAEAPDVTRPEEMERGLVFVGLIGMIDPPRLEVAPALTKARQAGIRTVM